MSDSRKRQKGLQGQPIDVSVTSHDSSAIPPALALFPSAQPPSKTPFTLYTKTGQPPRGDDDPAVLAAETDEIEFESGNHAQTGVEDNEGYSVQYMLAVRNPRSNTLTLHSAPLHTFTPSIKSLKAPSSSLTAAQLFTAQKAALGSAFGTKKAIKQLRAQERNKLNATSFGTGAAVSSLQTHLASTIAASSAALPSAQEIEDTANAARPIPPFNSAATSPNDVYDLSAIASPAELNSAVDLSALISAPSFKERNALLPFRRAHFVSTKLRQILPARASVEGAVPNPSKRDRERLKLVVHLSFLLAFRQAAQPGKAVDRQKLAERLGNPPNVVLEGLLERYTEKARGAAGEEVRKVTGVMEHKLLAYILVVVLKVDGWQTDVAGIADDLGMGVKRVSESFRSLGCVLAPPSAADREKMVATGAASTVAEAAKSKKAVLKVPLAFPKERRGQAKR
ncbi:hypothetical protein JCM6882_008637 [Rhodosporidiobolus microsporus]